MQKIDSYEYFTWRIGFFVENCKRSINDQLRLGQEFMNKFYPSSSDPELFYETDSIRAEQLIWTKYVETKPDE